jgi:Protein of unknown function (DUF992)
MVRGFRFATAVAAVGASVALGAGAADAQDANGVKTGTLVCNVSGGIGYIIGSRKAVHCTFTSARGRHERYLGHITKLGLDIGATTGGQIIWGVFEPTDHHASLGGEYGGVTAQATFGAGLGANVLIGGSNNAVALQPFSVEGQTGLNLAAGVGALTLHRER